MAPSIRDPEQPRAASSPSRPPPSRPTTLRLVATTALIIPLLFMVGCASMGSESQPFDRSSAEARNGSTVSESESSSRYLTGDDVRGTSVGNLYEVVQRLRPLWLSHGPPRSGRIRTEIMVVMNQSYFGSAPSLRELTPEDVRSIRYMDGAAASARFSYPGIQPHIVGAIVVEMGSGG